MRFGQGWSLNLRRLLNDWELGRIVEFYDTLSRFTGSSEDRLVLQPYCQGNFLVTIRWIGYLENDMES